MIKNNDVLKKPLVSLVIPNFNGVKYGILEICLKSVFNTDYPNFEVILVDNASTDDSIKLMYKKFNNKNLRIIQNSQNVYTIGLNKGILASKGKYIIFLNNDIRVTKEYVNVLVKAFESDDQIKLGQGLLLSDRDTTIIDNAGDFMDIYGNPTTRGRDEININQFSELEEILSASGSAFMIRSDILQEIGLFEPLYHIGYEDMDLALRVHLRGYKVMFIPNAIVYHKRAATDDAEENRIIIRHHFNKNRLMTILRNYKMSNLVRSVPLLVSFYLMAFLWELIIIRDCKLAITRFSGLFWTMKELKSVFQQRLFIQKRVRRVNKDVFTAFMSKSGVSMYAFINPKKPNPTKVKFNKNDGYLK